MPKRRLATLGALVVAVALMLIPSTAGAQGGRERFCQKNPQAAMCQALERREKVKEKHKNTVSPACTAAQKAYTKANKALAKSQKRAGKTKKGVTDAKGKRAKAKAKAKNAKAKKKVKKARKASAKALKAVQQAC